MDKALRLALEAVVQKFGFEEVEDALGKLREPKDEGRTETKAARRSVRGGAGARRRLTAVEYVDKLDMPAERAGVIARAAEEFERRLFLPTLGDIRSFCQTYGIDEPRSRSRMGGIPRVFKFLRTMEAEEVERMLDERLFSGPAELGPIAEAIRGRARQYREAAAGGR